MCCSVLQCVAVCCNALQCAAAVKHETQTVATANCTAMLQCVAECCSVLQSVAVCCSVSQCVALCRVCCSVLQCVAERRGVLQCAAVSTVSSLAALTCVAVVAVPCSMLQCVVVCSSINGTHLNSCGRNGEYALFINVIPQFPLRMLHPRNPPHQKTGIPQYFAVQIQNEFSLGARRRRCFSPVAAARHQGRSQRMREKFRVFIYPWVSIREFIYPGVRRINYWYPYTDKPPDFPPHALGPALMARSSFGAGRLAAACPFEFVPRTLSFFWIWWVLGV